MTYADTTSAREPGPETNAGPTSPAEPSPVRPLTAEHFVVSCRASATVLTREGYRSRAAYLRALATAVEASTAGSLTAGASGGKP